MCGIGKRPFMYTDSTSYNIRTYADHQYVSGQKGSEPHTGYNWDAPIYASTNRPTTFEILLPQLKIVYSNTNTAKILDKSSNPYKILYHKPVVYHLEVKKH